MRPWPKGPERVLAALLLALALAACSDDPGTGPAKIHWDRDVCERCYMAVSVRNYAAQARVHEGDGKSEIYQFDDIGCLVLWLDEQEWAEGWREDPNVELWVTDWRDSEWIDARKAWYVKGKTTPMEYGLGAQDEPEEGALDFAQAYDHVYKVEERFTEQGLEIPPIPEEYRRPKAGEHEHAAPPAGAG